MKTSMVLGVVAILLIMRLVSGGLITNGDFEEPPCNCSGTDEAVPNWTIGGAAALIILPKGGGQAVALVDQSEINQTIPTNRDSIYGIIFVATKTCTEIMSLRISLGDSSQTVYIWNLNQVQGMLTYVVAFPAQGDSEILSFQGIGGLVDSCEVILDSIIGEELQTTPTKSKSIINGGFENSPLAIPELGLVLPPIRDDQTSPLYGWKVDSTSPVLLVRSEVAEGSHAVQLVNGVTGVIAQKITTHVGTRYSLAFTARVGSLCEFSQTIIAYAGTKSAKFDLQSNRTATEFVFPFTAIEDVTRIAFSSDQAEYRMDDKDFRCGPKIDDVQCSSGARAAHADWSVIEVLLYFALMLLLVVFSK